MRITEAERIVKDALGEQYATTKINRYWMVYDGERRIVGQHTNLDRAIEQARNAK